MKHQLLTETKFFKLLEVTDNADHSQLQEEYHVFIGRVIKLSQQAHVEQEAMHSLMFAETELQFHPLLHSASECVLCVYVKKALAFIRKMMQQIKAGFYNMLGVNAKECYHIYADMKMRKNESRTYFLDKMQERVNRRMEMDEERERMRR